MCQGPPRPPRPAYPCPPPPSTPVPARARLARLAVWASRPGHVLRCAWPSRLRPSLHVPLWPCTSCGGGLGVAIRTWSVPASMRGWLCLAIRTWSQPPIPTAFTPKSFPCSHLFLALPSGPTLAPGVQLQPTKPASESNGAQHKPIRLLCSSSQPSRQANRMARNTSPFACFAAPANQAPSPNCFPPPAPPHSLCMGPPLPHGGPP